MLLCQTDAGWEEYYDYIFPDDESAQPNLKLLAMAKMWKKQTEETTTAVEDDDNDADDDDDDDDAADGLLYYFFIDCYKYCVLPEPQGA